MKTPLRYQMTEYDSEMLEEVYLRFLEIKEYERAHAWEGVQRFLEREELDTERESDFLTMILGLSVMSSYIKNIVQALLEEHYLYDDEKKELEKRERKEAKRAEKQAAKARAEEPEAGDVASDTEEE